MTPDQQPENTSPSFQIDPVNVYKDYIGLLITFQITDPNLYQQIPEILKTYSIDDVKKFTTHDIEALKKMNALPELSSNEVTEDQIKTERAYLQTIQRLKNNPTEYEKYPNLLKSFSKDDIENLDADDVMGLELMSQFLKSLIPKSQAPESQSSSTCAKHEEECACHSHRSSREEYSYGGPTIQEQIAQAQKITDMYNEAARNMNKSIIESNNAYGEAFKKLGGL